MCLIRMAFDALLSWLTLSSGALYGNDSGGRYLPLFVDKANSATGGKGVIFPSELPFVSFLPLAA